MNCGTCGYWQGTPRADHENDGECRYNPPVVVMLTHHGGSGQIITMAPKVARDFWCGEWADRELMKRIYPQDAT